MVHFVVVDFGEGVIIVSVDRGKAKSTTSPTDLNVTFILDWSLTIVPFICCTWNIYYNQRFSYVSHLKHRRPCSHCLVFLVIRIIKVV